MHCIHRFLTHKTAQRDKQSSPAIAFPGYVRGRADSQTFWVRGDNGRTYAVRPPASLVHLMTMGARIRVIGILTEGHVSAQRIIPLRDKTPNNFRRPFGRKKH